MSHPLPAPKAEPRTAAAAQPLDSCPTRPSVGGPGPRWAPRAWRRVIRSFHILPCLERRGPRASIPRLATAHPSLCRAMGSLTSEALSATWPGGGPCTGPLPLQGQLSGPCLSGVFSLDSPGMVNHAPITRSCGQLSLFLASLRPLKGSLWSLLPLIPALAGAGREARADMQLSF